MLNLKSGNIQTRHMQWKTHIELSIKRSGKEGNNGSISNLSQVRASTKGTCPWTCKISCRAGTEEHLEVALFHGAKVRAGRCSSEAFERTSIINPQGLMNADLIENRADWLSRPVCSVILYTTVTQYIPIAVKSAYPSNPVIVAFTLYLKYFSQVDLKSCFLFCSHCLRLQRLMPSLSAYSLCVRPSFIRIALICLPWPFLRKRL